MFYTPCYMLCGNIPLNHLLSTEAFCFIFVGGFLKFEYLYIKKIMSEDIRKMIDKVKNFKQFMNESLKYGGDDILSNDEILFHGTSLKQWDRIAENNFNVSDFYVGDSEDNIARNYAEIQSRNDDSDGILIVLNSEYLIGDLIDNYHGEDRQVG